MWFTNVDMRLVLNSVRISLWVILLSMLYYQFFYFKARNQNIFKNFFIHYLAKCLELRASLVAQRLKRLPGMREIRVRSLGQEDPLEKEMATHSSTLAWRITWREEPGRLQSMGSQRVGHNWATSLHFTSWVKGHSDYYLAPLGSFHLGF